MKKVKITGVDGLNKVRMSKAIREHTGRNLRESKSITDELMNEQSVVFEVLIEENAQSLMDALEDAGANANFVEE